MDTTAHTLTLEDYTLHYWTSGSPERPTVLFTHGATADHEMFNAQVAALAPDYHVVTWDVRGHGRSRPVKRRFTLKDCAADLIALLDALHVKQAVLVGQSMGGLISQYAYLQSPDRVRAMAVIGSVSIAFPYRWWEILALKLTMPLFQVWPYKHFARTVALQAGLKPDTQAYMLRVMSVLSRREFLDIWKAVTLAIDTVGHAGHHIRVPLLLTHGDQDNAGTIRRDAPKWAAYDPDVEYVVIPDAAHNANQDNPQFTNQVLRDFLQRTVGSESLEQA